MSKKPKNFNLSNKALVKWVDALLSGEFEQTNGQLCREDHDSALPETILRYCCLGVACEVMMPGKRVTGDTSSLKKGMWNTESGNPPTAVSKKLGIKPLQSTLIHLNDDMSASF